MVNPKLKNVFYGTVIAGGLATFGTGCSNKDNDQDDKDTQKTEVNTQQNECDPYGNIQLFEESLDKIKFALAYVENYYPFVYSDGKHWTAAHGLTVLIEEDGSEKKVTKNTPNPSIIESDGYKGRYLIKDMLNEVIIPDVHVPLDENTLLATCVLGYCIGPNALKNSSFLAAVNRGVTGPKLAKYLTGYRQQPGVLNRCYFFAALLENKITFDDLLDLRAEGCYNLEITDICKCKKNKDGSYRKIAIVTRDKKGHKHVRYKYDFETDKDNYAIWIFDDMDKKLNIAKQPRTVKVKTANGQKSLKCKLVKEIVADYVWQNVSNDAKIAKNNQKDNNTFYYVDANDQNDLSYTAYQNGDYATALKAGLCALKFAETPKQRGAASYNTGITYMKLGDYGKAVHYLELSLQNNPTKAAQTALDEANTKYKEQKSATRRNIAKGAGAVLALGLAVRYFRRRTR